MNLHRKLKGGLLAAAVALLLVNLILPFRIPLLKILITLGVAWAAWQWADPDKPHSRNAVFANERFRFSRGVNEERDENGTRVCRYVFSNAVLDLTDSSALPERIEIQAAFSNAVVRLPVDAAVTLHTSGAFCSISAPGQQNTVFGENTCQCGTQDPNAPRLYVEASCAFGSLSFKMG